MCPSGAQPETVPGQQLVDDAPIEADDSANFSDYDDSGSVASSTQSLSSSIREHVYANGRKYHRMSTDENQQYLLPSDETELDRLDMGHHACLVTLDGDLHRAPIEGDPHNVLDCGTGTGIWALDFGSLHPESHVIGVDLAPNQPSWTYPNVEFQTDDLEKDWTFKKNHFNFIFSRTVGTAIKDWERYTKQMFEHAAPGAYVELCEHAFETSCDDGSLQPDSIFIKWSSTMADALEKMGVHVRDFSPSFFRDHLKAAGFVDIKVFIYKVPWGAWPKGKKFKYLGSVCAEVMKTGLEAHGLFAMTRLLNMPEDEARKMCTDFYNNILAGKEHCYHYLWHVVGRKPDTQEEA
ncbi:S-adenosyl-L-methionine-dependent methyltransferase [Ascodesmis nigricans]|uniref:S-adenosyl-L-methionine-dependent methyltransferase n=1 Tax=Ascodesmis nigricans TaxID=341454 RepID=A0A4S2MRW6_9PEZI|nr:S-adenosyl-L-methionine-dependent methyltransferase [Ascodesmis nigricans]